jgi:hypothetical protein
MLLRCVSECGLLRPLRRQTIETNPIGRSVRFVLSEVEAAEAQKIALGS